jgi:hypothetical protein
MKAKLLSVAILAVMLGTMLAIPVMAEDEETTMWVSRVRVAWTGRSSGGTDWIVGMVHIRDANLQAVEGATVTAEWTLPDGTVLEKTAVTADVTGIATFGIWTGKGVYRLCVKDVTKEGWLYDPALNTETCGVVTSTSN